MIIQLHEYRFRSFELDTKHREHLIVIQNYFDFVTNNLEEAI